MLYCFGFNFHVLQSLWSLIYLTMKLNSIGRCEGTDQSTRVVAQKDLWMGPSLQPCIERTVRAWEYTDPGLDPSIISQWMDNIDWKEWNYNGIYLDGIYLVLYWKEYGFSIIHITYTMHSYFFLYLNYQIA